MTTMQATMQAHWEAQPLALPENDPTEMLATAERADWALLCMVSCVAAATLALAAASALLG